MRSGMTLIELSVVILIMGILFSVLFGVIFAAKNVTNKGMQPARQRQQAVLALENIRTAVDNTFYQADIERLLFYGASNASGEKHADTLTIASVIPGAEASGTPEVREVSFYLDTNGSSVCGDLENGCTLFRREDEAVDTKPGQGGAHYPLVSGVMSLRFRYSYNGKTWIDTWNTKKTSPLPRLIQIQMLVKVSEKRVDRLETLASPGLYVF